MFFVRFHPFTVCADALSAISDVAVAVSFPLFSITLARNAFFWSVPRTCFFPNDFLSR